MFALLFALLPTAFSQDIAACDTWAQENFHGSSFFCTDAISQAKRDYYTWADKQYKACFAQGGSLKKVAPSHSPSVKECYNSGATLEDATHDIFGLVECECNSSKDWVWTIDHCGDTLEVSESGSGQTCTQAKRRSKIKVGSGMMAAEKDCRTYGGTMVWDSPPNSQACTGSSGSYSATWTRSGTCECPEKTSEEDETEVTVDTGTEEELGYAWKASLSEDESLAEYGYDSEGTLIWGAEDSVVEDFEVCIGAYQDKFELTDAEEIEEYGLELLGYCE